MGPYLLIFGFTLLAGLPLIQNNNARNRAIYIVLVFSVLFFFAAFRAQSVGTDTYAYSTRIAYSYPGIELTFQNVANQKAPLYFIIMKLFLSVLPENMCYQIVTALFAEIGIGYYIYKNSKHCVISTWLYLTQYLYFQSLNISRQFMAISLIAIAIHLIIKHNALKALVAIVLASLLHSTAVVAIPMLLLAKKDKSREYIVFFICATVISVFLYPTLMNAFSQLFPQYGFYLNEGGRIYEVGQNRKIVLTLFELAFLVYAFGLYRKNVETLTAEDRNMFQVSMCLMIVVIAIGFAALNSLLLTRIEYYYALSFMLLVPLCIAYSERSANLVFALTVVVMAVPGFVLLTGGSAGVLPYRFIWQ